MRPRPRSAILKGGHQKPEGATTLVAAALCAASLIGIPLAARAAAAEPTAPPAALAPGDLLGRIVGRLSAAEAPGGLD